MNIKQPWKNLKRRLLQKDPAKIKQFFDFISPSEKARTLSHLDREDVTEIFSLLDPAYAAELLNDLPEEQAAGLIELIPTRQAAGIVDHLPKHDQIDILNEVRSEDTAQAIIDTMSPAEAKETREMLAYEDDTAGGIMITEILKFKDTTTVGEVLKDMEVNREKYLDYDVQYIYVTGPDNELKGVLPLRDMILSRHSEPVNRLMITKLVKATVNSTLEELVDLFENYDFLGLPVVNPNNQLVGVAKRYAVMEAVGERETDTFLKFSGIVGGEELRSMPIWVRSKRRLSWLCINIFLNIMAASIIAVYQDTIATVIALAVFLPIISDMSGCSGNQSVAVSIRELTMGIAKPSDIFNVILKESALGLINGLVLGLLLGGVAFLWKGNFYLGLVIGSALAINTLVAVTIGGILPLILHKMKKDPALASGPILTTVTDMCGFLITLGFATQMLQLIQ
ncbi:MAG: magnesium transporter [Candidatus Omnitrophota bacterium]